MQYSPKLKLAMVEVQAILKKHDVAGFVVLHTPGFVEYLNHLSPTYSCAYLNDGEFRVQLKTADVGVERAKFLAESTYNMVSTMTDVIALHAKGYIDFEEMLTKHWGGTGGDTNHTSHTQQNN